MPAPSQLVNEQQQQTQPKQARKRAAPAEKNKDEAGPSRYVRHRKNKKEEEEATARMVEEQKERIAVLEAENQQLRDWVTGLALLGHHCPVCGAVKAVAPAPVEAATAAQL